MRAQRTSWAAVALVGLGLAPALARAQYTPSDLLTKFRPSFKGVEYDIPEGKAAIDACKVETVYKGKKPIGFALRDGQGKMLRKFVDTNGIINAKGLPQLDRWSYYQDGFEVYREVDSNEDNALDECRWLNGGGTRIGTVKDGRIVAWTRISAEEASKVLVLALITQDAGLLNTVMASPEEVAALGAPEGLVKQVAAAGAERPAKARALWANLKAKGWDEKTAWMKFDGMLPHVIPADAGADLKDDLILFENAVIFATPPNQNDPRQLAYLHVPELVQIGATWKFLDLPRAVDPVKPDLSTLAQANGLRSWIFRENATGPVENDALLAVLKALAEHDKTTPAPDAGKKAVAQWHLDRISLLHKAIAAASKEEKENYYKQVVHDLAEAYQTGLYPDGAAVFEKLIALGGKIAPFAAYRKILAEFNLEVDQPGANVFDAQKGLLKKLEAFLKAYPRSDEEPDVLLELATAHEFNGSEKEARDFYGRLARDYAASDPGKRAAGALRRLDLDGKPLQIRGPSLAGKPVGVEDYRGKTLLVVFWNAGSEANRRELAELAQLYETHRQKGFEILGVNLDGDRATVEAFLRENSIPWTQIVEPGGMENNRLAQEFGIISTPAMFLVDPRGNVVNRKIRKASEVEKALEKPVVRRTGDDLNLGAK